jgi:hypothetical protein
MRWFKYEPIVPCRPDIYGEGIFVSCWQCKMRKPEKYGDGEPNEKFAGIVSPWAPIADDAAAASSFICWLGTNCGRSFLHSASTRMEKLKPCEAYALTWAMENRRLPGWNGHRRTIEAIISADRLTLRSVEIVEIVVRWLGTTDGAAMIKEAELEIEETAKEIREQNMMKARARERAAELVARRAY